MILLKELYPTIITQKSSSLLKESKGAKFMNTKQEFIPFKKERDCLGRLIKSESVHSSPIKVFLDTAQTNQSLEKFKSKPISDSNHAQVDNKINNFFKVNHTTEKTSTSKNKITKKCSILIEDQKPHEKIILNEIKFKRKESLNKQSSKLFKFVTTGRVNTSEEIKKKRNTIVHRKYSNIEEGEKISPQRVKERLKNNLKAQEIEQQRKGHVVYKGVNSENNESLQKYMRCSELKTYNRMQTLAVSPFDDFEDGHSKFLKKMKQSKHLAYKIRVELDKC